MLRVCNNQDRQTSLPVRRAHPAFLHISESLKLKHDRYFMVSANARACQFPMNSFVWFLDRGFDEFDFYFRSRASHVFVDATVSQLGVKLPTETADAGRERVILVISTFLDETVVLKENEICFARRASPRNDLTPSIVFIVATTEKQPSVLKTTVGWVRFSRLDDLVAARIIPESAEIAVAASNSKI